MKKHIKVERTFNKPIATVWNAISKGEELNKWFMEVDFQPQVGYNYTFIQHHEDGGKSVIKGKVLEVVPNELLSYTWLADGSGVDGIVKWILKEINGATQVIIEHESLEEESANPAIIPMFLEFEEGWAWKLKDLGKFIT